MVLAPPTDPTHLHMALWLHETSHHTKAGKELCCPGNCCHGRDDGVVRPLAWGQAVWVGGLQGEVGAAVLQEEKALNWWTSGRCSSHLQGEATPLRHQPRPKAHVVTVDEGGCVAMGVHHSKVHCVAGGRGWGETPLISRQAPEEACQWGDDTHVQIPGGP